MHQDKKIHSAHTLAAWHQSLKRKHADVDAMIREESQQTLPDFLKIQELKRYRLHVKDEIKSIEGVLRTVDMASPQGVA
ncbi:MAG: YdcH family protein [Pseudomonadota bacterium]